MPECEKYRSVMVAKSYEQYVEMLDRALARKNDPEYLALLRAEARENSWAVSYTHLRMSGRVVLHRG